MIKVNSKIPSFLDTSKYYTEVSKQLYDTSRMTYREQIKAGENAQKAWQYYSQTQNTIESLWREIAKDKEWFGGKSEMLISFCYDGIFRLRKALLKEEMYLGYYTMPRSFCYERLSMLYEKRKEYDKALEAIDDYLKYCLYVDDTNTLYKRKSRILKKINK